LAPYNKQTLGFIKHFMNCYYLTSWSLQDKQSFILFVCTTVHQMTDFRVSFSFTIYSLSHVGDFPQPVHNNPLHYLMAITQCNWLSTLNKLSKYKLQCFNVTIIWNKITNSWRLCQRRWTTGFSQQGTQMKQSCAAELFSAECHVTPKLHLTVWKQEETFTWRRSRMKNYLKWGFMTGPSYLPISRHYTLITFCGEALEGVREQITWSMVVVAGTGVSAPESTLAEIKKLQRTKHARTI
jgi:hypothetical protein